MVSARTEECPKSGGLTLPVSGKTVQPVWVSLTCQADQTDRSGSAAIKTAATVSGQFTMEGFFLKSPQRTRIV